eukprot:127614-Chlamydomonas_euryale.AAC.1
MNRFDSQVDCDRFRPLSARRVRDGSRAQGKRRHRLRDYLCAGKDGRTGEPRERHGQANCAGAKGKLLLGRYVATRIDAACWQPSARHMRGALTPPPAPTGKNSSKQGAGEAPRWRRLAHVLCLTNACDHARVSAASRGDRRCAVTGSNWDARAQEGGWKGPPPAVDSTCPTYFRTHTIRPRVRQDTHPIRQGDTGRQSQNGGSALDKGVRARARPMLFYVRARFVPLCTHTYMRASFTPRLP